MLNLIWYAGTAAIPVILFLMAYRRTLREFPCFALYLSTTLLWSLVMIAIADCRSMAYQRAYFIGGAMMFAAQLGSVYELLTSLFIRKHRFVHEFCCVSVAVGVVCFALQFFTFDYASVSYVALAGSLVRWIVASGLGFVIVKRKLVGLHWRKRPFGILVGLLITLLTDTAVAALIPHFHALPLLRFTGPLLYFIAAVTWILTFVRKDTNRITITQDEYHRIIKPFTDRTLADLNAISCVLQNDNRAANTPKRTKSESGARLK